MEYPAVGHRYQMVSDIQNLEEIVVVGYGTQRKETLTGSIANVAGKRSRKALLPISAVLLSENYRD